MMTVIVTENVPPRLRGRLSIWMLELRAGVYVGDLSKRHRDHVWETVRDQVNRHQGNAVIAWASPNEQGFEFDTVGKNRRIPRRLDGATLISFLAPPIPPPQITEEADDEDDWLDLLPFQEIKF